VLLFFSAASSFQYSGLSVHFNEIA
jgi:hypothetical protein